jgi:hypothetical protein
MAQTIDVPSIGAVDFPDAMSDDEIKKAIEGLLAKQQPPSLPRQLGLTARAGLSGLPSVVTSLVGDPLANLMNLAAGRRVAALPSQTIERGLTAAGLPEPAEGRERAVYETARAMAGAGAGAGMAAATQPLAQSQTARNVLGLLSSSPGAQVVGTGVSEFAGQSARQAGATPGQEIIARLLGATTPNIPQIISGGVRAAMRGGPQAGAQMRENIATMQQAMGPEAPITAGTTSTGGLGRIIEGGLRQTLGGQPPIMGAVSSASEALGESAQRLAGQLTRRTDSAVAGRAIQRGVDKFVDDFRVTEGTLWDSFSQKMPPTSQVPIDNFRQTVGRLTTPVQGAEQTSQLFMSKIAPDLSKAIETDLTAYQTGSLPLEAAKRLRSLIGSKLSDPKLLEDFGRGEIKQMYASLTRDIESAARAQGGGALEAFNRASKYTRSGHARIDEILEPLTSSAVPERVFNAVLSGSKAGSTVVRTVMKSLDDDQAKIVSGTILERLGKATPGRQDASGQLFSPETFLTNWNSLITKNPGVKESLFNRYGMSYAKDVDKIAEASALLRQAASELPNPSGTGRATAFNNAFGKFVTPMIGAATGAESGGAMGATLGIAGTVAVENAAGRLMAYPPFVRWLARQTEVSSGALPNQLRLLEKIASSAPDEEKSLLMRYIQSFSQ